MIGRDRHHTSRRLGWCAVFHHDVPKDVDIANGRPLRREGRNFAGISISTAKTAFPGIQRMPFVVLKWFDPCQFGLPIEIAKSIGLDAAGGTRCTRGRSGPDETFNRRRGSWSPPFHISNRQIVQTGDGRGGASPCLERGSNRKSVEETTGIVHRPLFPHDPHRIACHKLVKQHPFRLGIEKKFAIVHADTYMGRKVMIASQRTPDFGPCRHFAIMSGSSPLKLGLRRHRPRGGRRRPPRHLPKRITPRPPRP